MRRDHDTDFVTAARKRRSSLVHEMWALLRENKKWWLTPIVLAILLLGLLSLLAGSSIAPFIYTLF
jgi:Family of unknown function (DUF5989)